MPAASQALEERDGRSLCASRDVGTGDPQDAHRVSVLGNGDRREDLANWDSRPELSYSSASMPEREISFLSDGNRLAGWIAVPAAARFGVVVCHPHPLYGGNVDFPLIARVCAALGAAGTATLRFDFRGAGRSEGRHDELAGASRDAALALGVLAAESGAEVLGIAGYSFGAVVALEVGAVDSRVERIAAVAPPLSMIEAPGIDGSSKPILMLAGTRDDFTPYAELAKRVPALRLGQTTVVEIPGADHFLAGREDEIASRLVEFFGSL